MEKSCFEIPSVKIFLDTSLASLTTIVLKMVVKKTILLGRRF
jgi:hypothetical protein